MHRVMLFSKQLYQATWSTHLYSFLQFGQRQIYCWFLYFSVQTLFFVVFSSISRCSLQYVWNLSLSGISGLPRVLSLIYELLIKALPNSTRIYKTIICLELIFHPQTCIQFSTHYKKEKLGWSTRSFFIHSPKIFGV